MPQMQDALGTFDTIYEFWRDVLGLPDMDREVFVARLTANWNRYSVRGITLDPVCLAAIIIAAARLDLTFDEIKALRVRVTTINAQLLEAAERAS
jgi:hypothetical protein